MKFFKHFSSAIVLTAAAIMLSSCARDNNCCDPCAPSSCYAPRCCANKPQCPQPVCPQDSCCY